MQIKIYLVRFCYLVLLYAVYRVGFFYGSQFGENQARVENLPAVVHSFSNVSVSRSGEPHVVTFRVSFQDGVPAVGESVYLKNDSGFLMEKTDTNGFATFYYGKSSFNEIEVGGTNRMWFQYNDYAEPIKLGQYGLDFTIILAKSERSGQP